MSEAERNIVAIVYHHRDMAFSAKSTLHLAFVSCIWLLLMVLSEFLNNWLGNSAPSIVLGWIGIFMVFLSAIRWVWHMNLHVYRYLPLSPRTLVVSLWKYTIVNWYILLGQTAPFGAVGFCYVGWPIAVIAQFIAIVAVFIPVVAMLVHLIGLYVGTRQAMKPLDFAFCILIAILFFLSAIGIGAFMTYSEDPMARIAIALLFWPWTLILFFWGMHRYNHRTLDVGSPWPGY